MKMNCTFFFCLQRIDSMRWNLPAKIFAHLLGLPTCPYICTQWLFQQDFRIVSDGLPRRQRSHGVIDFRLETVKYGRAVCFITFGLSHIKNTSI